MNLRGLDLNLLIALDVLLEERSVSRAARRLHVSQPAMSASLNRLRTYFQDEILVLYGKQMIPTSFANDLIPALQRVLVGANDLISMSSEFDPVVTERKFRLMTSDYLISVLLTPLVATLENIAPNVSLDIQLPSVQGLEEFERSEIDLYLTPENFVSPHHPTELLFEESFVVVGWSGNPVFERPLTRSVFCEARHVSVAIGHGRDLSYVDKQLEAAKVVRKIEIYAPGFAVVPGLLYGTNRLSVIHERMARMIAPSMELKFVPLPFDVPPMREMMQFHSAKSADSGLAWLRETILSGANMAPSI